MARRAKPDQGDGWVILVGVAFALLGVAGQAILDHWPILLIVLGATGCVWGLRRRRRERRAVAAADSVALALTRAIASPSSGWTTSLPPIPATGQTPAMPEPDTAHLEPGGSAFPGGPLAGTGPSGSSPGSRHPDATDAILASVATASAVAIPEPEFRISAIVDAPQPRPTPGGRVVPVGKRVRWIRPGETVEVNGLTIVAGMIYVGEKLTAERWGAENCLINPALPVARPGGASTDGMGYWSRYDRVSPANRRAYLEWLASGRRDPSAAIGLVFLFFYGLEHRLFKERAVDDGPGLVSEVERLLELYGSQHAFRGYAKRFLEAARLAVPGQPERRPAVVLDGAEHGYEMPLDARIWLGRKLATAQTLDADDALLWLAALPDRGFRTPVTRCPEEFLALWRLRFAAGYPGGLKVNPPKARIKATYRSASATFEVTLRGPHEDLPDIGVVSAPVRKLRDLVEACTMEIEAYSRLVGKRPEARSGAQAALLLPPELTASHPGWAALRDRVESLFAGQLMATIPLADLFGLADLPSPPPGRVPQAAMTQLCQILDRVGVAFEPDRRYGGAALDAAASVCAFQAPGGAPVDPDRADYQMFRGLIDITCLAAASDGDIAPAEIETVLVDLRAATVLSAAERARLTAYARSIHVDPPKQQAVLKRLAARSLADREACSRAALAAVMADGRAAPAEVRFLERLHKALSLPVETIYGAIHRGAPDAAAPVPGAPAGAHVAANDVVAIDASRLERIRRETQAVSSLLSDIFVDDAPESGAVDPPAASRAATEHAASGDAIFPGLDAAHADLLSVLLAEGTVSRAVLDREARARRLLPDGALETINEWAFDRLGEALLDGDDELTVAAHLRDPLSLIQVAA